MDNKLQIDIEKIKKDLALIKRSFITKDEAKKFVTKKDLENYTTKDDLKEAVENIINYVDSRFATKEEFEELRAQVSNLPTKDEFYNWMSKLMKEIKGSHEEQTIISYKSSENRDRIEKLEEVVYN